MEEFWDNIKAIAVLLIKVSAILIAIDLGALVFKLDFRIPYFSLVNDWIFSKIAAFS